MNGWKKETIEESRVVKGTLTEFWHTRHDSSGPHTSCAFAYLFS